MILFFMEMVVAFSLGFFSEFKGLVLRDCILAGVLIFSLGVLINPVLFPEVDYLLYTPITYGALSSIYFVIGWLMGNSL